MYIYFLLLVHIPGGPFYEGLNRGVSALFVPNINLDINSNPMCLEIEKKRYNDIESHDFIVFDYFVIISPRATGAVYIYIYILCARCNLLFTAWALP
ncbi:hypothetical protein ACN38_g10904 [Penicillium nordicum]|uniref:Uncharacterized protein n=1 Tax=Penicillium nordicum TaxID=229535 RepID=A0A0N0RXQ6_9EURO|nr:hypothetical protein ACN38_g10904 [Penicillium nordicum]